MWAQRTNEGLGSGNDPPPPIEACPATFSGCVFIVQHTAPYASSTLPEILSKSGPLKAVHAKNDEVFRPGKIYVASPDHHMLLERGNKILIKKGPKENRFRPSIDALFRSAAHWYRSRVIGVVLSGMLDDGTSGLWSIKRMGGLSIVQEPREAAFPGMPTSVLESVKVDHSAAAGQIPTLLVKLSAQTASRARRIPAKELKRLEIEIMIATHDNAFEMGIIEMGELTAFTCPECHGALSRLKESKIVRFRCHTGHAFTLSALLSEVSESVEDMLWQAMRGLEETNMLLTELGQHFDEHHKEGTAASAFFSKAKMLKEQARVVYESVFSHELLSGDLRFKK